MGFVLDPHDEKVWASKMIELSKSQDLSQSMGLEGFRILEENYNSQIMYQNIIRMYNDIIQK